MHYQNCYGKKDSQNNGYDTFDFGFGVRSFIRAPGPESAVRRLSGKQKQGTGRNFFETVVQEFAIGKASGQDHFWFFLTILPLDGADGPELDTFQEIAGEREDSSPVLSFDFPVKYTLLFLFIPEANGSNVIDVDSVEEDSGVSESLESSGSVVQ